MLDSSGTRPYVCSSLRTSIGKRAPDCAFFADSAFTFLLDFCGHSKFGRACEIRAPQYYSKFNIHSSPYYKARNPFMPPKQRTISIVIGASYAMILVVRITGARKETFVIVSACAMLFAPIEMLYEIGAVMVLLYICTMEPVVYVHGAHISGVHGIRVRGARATMRASVDKHGR